MPINRVFCLKTATSTSVGPPRPTSTTARGIVEMSVDDADQTDFNRRCSSSERVRYSQ